VSERSAPRVPRGAASGARAARREAPRVEELSTVVVDELGRARDRTLALLEPFDDDELQQQVSPLMSPLVWDLAHIAHYEELWLLRAITDARPTDPRYDDLYDAFKHPRRERAELDILGPAEARAFAADVRGRVLDHLATVTFDGDPLLHDAFVYGMVIQHEHQHDETMLATIDLMEREYEHPDVGLDDPPRLRADGHSFALDAQTAGGVGDGFVPVAGGTVTLGTDAVPWAYDNERPAHDVQLRPYRIRAGPVTNAEYEEFVAVRGYRDDRVWSAAGRAWRDEAGLAHPQGWRPEGDGAWSRMRFGHRDDLAPDDPVQHVCWYEAEAFARWAGARLPSEAEWEAAALAGALGETGCVWEWTASDFLPYPGFRSFPYREYSQVFFGDEYKVLRGGSWATDPVACRPTFRNWDFPIRRQIFSGFRLAADDR
jgi:gamma-glutamyl hercynylcysteine S-oxide synthase